MLEAVARALRQAYLDHERKTSTTTWENLPPERRAKWYAMACAAMTTMRER